MLVLVFASLCACVLQGVSLTLQGVPLSPTATIDSPALNAARAGSGALLDVFVVNACVYVCMLACVSMFLCVCVCLCVLNVCRPVCLTSFVVLRV